MASVFSTVGFDVTAHIVSFVVDNNGRGNDLRSLTSLALTCKFFAKLAAKKHPQVLLSGVQGLVREFKYRSVRCLLPILLPFCSTKTLNFPRNKILDTIVHDGHIDLVRLLIDDGRTTVTSDLFDTAISKKHVEISKLLLKCPGIDFHGYSFQKTLIRVCKNGPLDLATMLMEDDRVHVQYHTCFQTAIYGNQRDIVAMLLANDNVDPTRCLPNVMSNICTRGYVEMLHILLEDGRIPVTCVSLKHAIRHDRVQVVSMLLDCDKIDVNQAIGTVIETGRLPIVQMFIDREIITEHIAGKYMNLVRRMPKGVRNMLRKTQPKKRKRQ